VIRVIRSSTPLPRTRTVIKAGDIVCPWRMPDERQERRRWQRGYSQPDPIFDEVL